MNDDVCSENWGRWTFSKEASEKLARLLEETNANNAPNRTSVLEKICHQFFDAGTNRTEQQVILDEEYHTDSSVSTDVDDADWQELKAYANKSCVNENIKHQFEKLAITDDQSNEFVVPTTSKTGIGDKADSGSKKNIKKAFDLSMGDLLLDITQSQIIETEPVEENDIAYLLREALDDEDSDDNEIITILNSNEITDQELLDVWSQLESNSSRLRLCSFLQYDKSRSIFLCQQLLLPWLINDKLDLGDEIVRKISEFIPRFPDIGVKNLIIPLLNSKSCTIFTKDIFLLRDMMSKLEPRYWKVILQVLLVNMKITKWHLPLLKLIIESMSDEEININNINRLLLLMNTVLSEFSNDRDFGLLIMAVVSRITKMRNVSELTFEHLINIGDNYKGAMHFKIISAIKQLSKN